MLSFTQAPPQKVCPGGQVQALFTQLSPEGQAIPHALQLFGSVLRLTHVPLQLFSPDWQVSPHMPPEQTSPAGHTVVQEPQCALSVCSFTHVPPQFVSPAWHDRPHMPTEHTLPAGQTCPHVPQF